MKLQDQVTNLKLSKKLKDWGVKQESLFYWIIPTDSNYQPNPKNKRVLVYTDQVCHDENCKHDQISAFTASELEQMLPTAIYVKKRTHQWEYWLNIERLSHGWFMFYRHGKYVIAGATEAKETDCRAKLLIDLIENKLINL